MDSVKQVAAEEASASGILKETTSVLESGSALQGSIDCGAYNYCTIFVEYEKGDETSITLTPYILRIAGGTEFPYMQFTNSSGTRSKELGTFPLTGTQNVYFTLDVSGITLLKLYNTTTGGTPTGTLGISYTLTED